MTEFLQTVVRTEPKFIALHMQEVGGKTYEKSMQYVREFTDRLCESPEMKAFDKIRIYLDEDYSSAEKFTVSLDYYIYRDRFLYVVKISGLRKYLFRPFVNYGCENLGLRSPNLGFS